MEKYRARSPIIKKGTYTEGPVYIIPNGDPVKKKKNTIISPQTLSVEPVEIPPVASPVIAQAPMADAPTQVAQAAPSEEKDTKKDEHTPFELGNLVMAEDDATRLDAIKVLQKRLEAYGLDPRSLLKIWMADPTLFGERVYRNLEVLEELTRLKPRKEDAADDEIGIAQGLFEQFHIRNFANFPIEMLVKQYEQKDDETIAYGLIVSPELETDGVKPIPKEVIEKLGKTFGNSYAVRIVEASGKSYTSDAVFHNYLKYKKGKEKYPQGVSFMVIAGKTEETGIRVAAKGAYGELTIPQLAGKWYFKKNPKGSFLKPGGLVVVTQKGEAFDKISEEVSTNMQGKLVCLEDVSDIESLRPLIRRQWSWKTASERRKPQKKAA